MKGHEHMTQQPTYKHITSYAELHAFLQEYLRKEQLEVSHLLTGSRDEVYLGLQQIRDDLLHLADVCNVVGQDIASGVIVADERK
jgi:hypothetical protein